MKTILFFIAALTFGFAGFCQSDIYPAPPNNDTIVLQNAVIHVGNGKVIENGTVIVSGSKIQKVGVNLVTPPQNARVIDLKGAQLYPGLISSITNLGIKDVGQMVPGSEDYQELGEINTNIRSIVAYNSDNPVINVLRTNGILLANVVPQNPGSSSFRFFGGASQLISGTSSVVQLDAWTWEDAAYQIDGQMHLQMPSLVRPNIPAYIRSLLNLPAGVNPADASLKKVDSLKSFFRAAQSYLGERSPAITNLRFEATKGLFNGTQRLFVHCNGVKEMLVAVDLAKEFGFRVAIVGGADSWQIAALLKENDIPVILSQMHELPATRYDDVDQPYKTPYLLKKAGVLFAISDADANTTGRNLMFNAGTAAAYGLTKEEALRAITLDAAQILGIDDRTGSIEEGKDANIVISKGDILDMRSSVVERAFVQGREINLGNKQTKLAERYEHRYGIRLEEAGN